jgi:hypothetical protein
MQRLTPGSGTPRALRHALIKRKHHMRAVQLTSFGDPVDVLQYVDIPEPEILHRREYDSVAA